MDASSPPPGTGWAKPGVVLALFCVVNFIVYCDRGEYGKVFTSHTFTLDLFSTYASYGTTS